MARRTARMLGLGLKHQYDLVIQETSLSSISPLPYFTDLLLKFPFLRIEKRRGGGDEREEEEKVTDEIIPK